MTARILFGGAAGMEDGNAFLWWDAGQFQFLERGCGYKRDVCPIANVFGREATGLANPAISKVMLELQREKFQREFVESAILLQPRGDMAKAGGKV